MSCTVSEWGRRARLEEISLPTYVYDRLRFNMVHIIWIQFRYQRQWIIITIYCSILIRDLRTLHERIGYICWSMIYIPILASFQQKFVLNKFHKNWIHVLRLCDDFQKWCRKLIYLHVRSNSCQESCVSTKWNLTAMMI